jgi:hypothetical protein
MSKRTQAGLLQHAIAELDASIDLTARAALWQAKLHHYTPARFNKAHFSQIVELAFMKSFLNWETFLEESFVLYLLGKRSPSGYLPVRHAVPISRPHAISLLLADSRHTDWTAADRIINRAERFFVGGRPYVNAIQPRVQILNKVKTLRNAISHSSDEATEKFRTLVRNELTFYPQGMAPGTFLMRNVPNVTPPQSYFHFFTEHIGQMVEDIIPV